MSPEILLFVVAAVAACGAFLFLDYALSGWRRLRKLYPARENVIWRDEVPGETFVWNVVWIRRRGWLSAADIAVTGIFVTVTTGGILLSNPWLNCFRGIDVPWRAVTRAEWKDSWWGGKVVLTIEGFDGHVSIRWPPARLIYDRWMKFKSYFNKEGNSGDRQGNAKPHATI